MKTVQQRRKENFNSKSSSPPCSGLGKKELVKNDRNKIVSKKKQKLGNEIWNELDVRGPKGWLIACKEASQTLDWPVPIKRDTPFYKLAKKIHTQMIKDYELIKK